MAPRKAAPAAAPIVTPPPARETIRPEIRETQRVMAPHGGIGHNSQGRIVVLNRAGQPVSRSSAASGVDQFFIPPDLVPPGWSWEWKRTRIIAGSAEEDPAYQAELAQVGWEPVMAESFPGVFAPIDAKGPIVRRGLMLMERDERLTKEARLEEKRRADERVGTAVRKHSLNTAGAHGVSIDDSAVRQNTYVRKSMEAVNVPPPQYQRTGQSVD